MTDDSQRILIVALRRRDRSAWARIYDDNARDVFSFIAHLMRGNRAAAEELHQATWLAALEAIDRFDVERGELRGWVFGIARRQVALHFRRRGDARGQHVRYEETTGDGKGGQSLLPDDVLASVERGDAVRAALAELGAESRRALVGKYVDGQSVKELAHRLGRSPKAVESLLSRAKVRMRNLLQRYLDDTPVERENEP